MVTATRNITKSLAVMEDLLAGVGEVQQKRGIGNKIDVPFTVTSTEKLRLLDVNKYTRARVRYSETVYTDFLHSSEAATGIQPYSGVGYWVPTSSSSDALDAADVAVAGYFSEGLTFNTTDDVGVDSYGRFWSYIGALPRTVEAGTVPNNAEYRLLRLDSGNVQSIVEEIIANNSPFTYEVPSFSGVLITDLPFTARNVDVSVNGRLLGPSQRTIEDDGDTIRLKSAVTTSDVVLVHALLMLSPTNSPSSGDFEYVRLSDYGITSEGTPDDAARLAAAIADGNVSGKAVKGARNLKIVLTGSDNISVGTEVDFGGAELDISDWGGKFEVNNSEWVSYTAGSTVFDSIVNTGMLTSDRIPAWATLDEVNNSYVKLKTNGYYFTYREVTINHVDYNFVTNRGKLKSRILDIDTSKLTSVEVLKMPDKRLYFGNATVVIGYKTIGVKSILVRDSGFVDVKDIIFKNNPNILLESFNPTVLEFADCARCTQKNLSFTSPLRADNTAKYNYGTEMEHCYDMKMENMVGYGEGWSTTGNNMSRRIEFKNCELNCIDFHKPFVEYMKISDCIVGSWGVLMTAIGDLLIRDSKFINNGDEYFSQRSYIGLNDSAGGFCNGNLRITNTKFENTTGTLMLLFLNKATAVGGIREPSALTKTSWDSFIVENCDFGRNNETAIMPASEDDNGIRYPYQITFSKCRGDIIIQRDLIKSLPRFDVRDDETNLVKPHNLFITIDDVEHVADKEIVLMDRRDQNFKIHLSVNNLRATEATDVSGVNLGLIFGGDAYIANTQIEGFRFYDTFRHLKPLNVHATNITLNYVGRLYTSMFEGLAQNASSNITVSNSTVIGTVDTVKQFAGVRSSNCTMKVNDSRTFYNSITVTDSTPVNIANGSTGAKSALVPVEWDRQLEITIAIGTGGAYRVPIALKDDNAEQTVAVKSGYFTVTRTGSTITVVNSLGAATNLYFYGVNAII